MKAGKHLLFVLWLLMAGKIVAQPTISTQPTNQIVFANSSNTTFTVAVADAGIYAYQWQLNGTNLRGGIITTAIGNGQPAYYGDNGAATNAKLNNPYGMAVDSSGNVFIADSMNRRVRKVSTDGIITTVAGNGAIGYSGDGGMATNAKLFEPDGVAVDNYGNIFIADCINNARIRKVNTNGIIVTIAGNGTNGYAGDGGEATNAELNGVGSYPFGLTVDAIGNLFVADIKNNRIRKVDTNGIITTVAGGGTAGDGGAATNAGLNWPSGVAVDAAGNIFIADNLSRRVRKVDTNGIITTVAGNGVLGYSGDGGMATNAQVNPYGINFDASGNLFIAEVGDNNDRRIRKVDTNGIITTVAGSGPIGNLGAGGMATNATIGCPFGVGFDPLGNLLILDELSVVWKVWFAGLPTLQLNNLHPNSAGNYQVIVTGSSGSVTSSVAALTISYPPCSLAFVSTNNGYFMTLAWPAFQPSTFQVEFTTNLTSANWSNLGNTITYSASSNGIVQAVDPFLINNPQRFYRLRWVQ